MSPSPQVSKGDRRRPEEDDLINGGRLTSTAPRSASDEMPTVLIARVTMVNLVARFFRRIEGSVKCRC